MKLHLTMDGAPGQIEILSPGPACCFRLNGEQREAAVETPEPGVYSVLLNGRVYDARIEELADGARGVAVVIDGFRFVVEVRDPRRMAAAAAQTGRQGAATVAAPMPGKVVRVLVALGDQVEAGQGIAVVEAMKMQNEMKAAHAGRVASLRVKEGDTVSAGQTLATIE
ncbi:MAG TPA: biotin/lipoyl-containing protein [Bryobacteraceae bacterium]|nr:biotin/lipoyl-containing protein [Bryobacteraceae bacterium]